MPPSVTDYTPLETLRLIELVPQHQGFDPEHFAKISNDIINDVRIRAEEGFDEHRLTPDALQELFLELLRQQPDPNEAHSNGNRAPGSVSPNSKKRKLPSPPVPYKIEVRGHLHKLQALDERLYQQYMRWRIDGVKGDEERYFKLQKEIAELEAEEEAEKAQKAAAASAAGPSTKLADQKQSPVDERATAVVNGNQNVARINRVGVGRVNGAVAPPASVPTLSNQPSQPPPARISPLLPRPGPPVSSTGTSPTPPAFAPPNIPPQGPNVHPVPGSTSSDTPKPAVTPGPILQAPQGTVAFSPQPASSTPHPGLETPRAESIVRPKSTSQPNAPSPAPGSLKWEPPYTPNASQRQGPGPGPPPPLSQSPVAGRATPVAPQYQHGAQSMQPPFTTPTIPPQQQQQIRQPHQPVLAAPQIPSNLAAPNLSGIPPSQAPLSANLQQQAPHPAQFQPTPGRVMPGQASGIPSIPARASPVASPNLAVGAGPPANFQPPQRQQIPLQGPQVAHGTPVASSSVPPAGTFGTPITAGPAHRPVNTPLSRLGQQSVADTLAQRVAAPSIIAQQQQNQFSPHTPLTSRTTPLVIPRGSGTRWKAGAPTPSTPRLGIGEVNSPAFEPLSPPLVAAKLPAQTSQTPGQKVPLKVASTPDATVSRRRGKAVAANEDSREVDVLTPGPRIKSEDDAGLRPPEETADATGEESGRNQRQATTPGSTSSRAVKRKRAGSTTKKSEPPRPAAVSTPPTHVLWTRGFPKISASVLDHISSHKNANMFAHKIRDRDAPGYSNIVLHPIDLKSIRAAIHQGNRAAIAASNALTNGDPGTSSVWLPISEELIPPRAIINSCQLECELIHMFANAIMYNPDPSRGFGPAFMLKTHQEGDEDDEENANVLGYEVDQDAVVNETLSMYGRVQELLTEMRTTTNAERFPPPLPDGATGTGSGSSYASFAVDADRAVTEDDGEQAANTEVEAEGSGTVKRRRTARA